MNPLQHMRPLFLPFLLPRREEEQGPVCERKDRGCEDSYVVVLACACSYDDFGGSHLAAVDMPSASGPDLKKYMDKGCRSS